MYQLTLPDARTRALPTRWGEVTLGQSARLAELPESADIYSLLSVLLDLSPLEVMNLPAAFVTEQVLPAVEFATTGELPDLSRGERPRVLHVLARGAPGALLEIPVLADLSTPTFGQATDLGALLQDATVPVPEKRIRALAILLYPAYSGSSYDSDAIEAFAADVCAHAHLEEALPLTDFFLTSSLASGATTLPSSSAFPSALTSAPPASKPWWKSGMRWLWSTRWPLATKPSGPTSGASAGAR